MATQLLKIILQPHNKYTYTQTKQSSVWNSWPRLELRTNSNSTSWLSKLNVYG